MRLRAIEVLGLVASVAAGVALMGGCSGTTTSSDKPYGPESSAGAAGGASGGASGDTSGGGGGDSVGSADNDPSDPNPPDGPDVGMPSPSENQTDGVQIVFPPSSATAADMLTVRGWARQTDGITGVRVNGSPATSTNGFTSWSVDVPLTTGNNTLVAEMTTTSGAVVKSEAVTVTRGANAATLTRGADPNRNYYMHGFTVDGSAAYFTCASYDGLVRVDFSTGDHTLLRCDKVISAWGAVVVPERKAAFLVDGSRIAKQDLATGACEIVKEIPASEGEHSFRSIVYDAGNDRGLVLDTKEANRAVRALNLDSGELSTVSSATMGAGAAYGSFHHLAADITKGRVLTLKSYSPEIYAIDLFSGDRSVFAAAAGKAGEPALDAPGSLATDENRRIVYVWDQDLHRLVSIDLDTGTRRVVADQQTGSGVALSSLSGVSVAQGVVFAWDAAGGGPTEHRLVAVDPMSGQRVLVARWAQPD